MPEFTTVSRRLVMRYASGSAFSFTKVRANAPDQGMFDLATAIATIQSQEPTKITTVVTRQLI
ncbi:MAG: hypothetical protein FWD03_04110 [Defluviitaleaceae bacterium]|nr:hypothetical protein [Defluviitaleaceae bacterium]